MQLLKDVWRLVRGWLKQDRIRTAPSVGRLLNLEAGTQLLFRDEVYQVERRQVDAGESQVATRYSLVTVGDQHAVPATMTVAFQTQQPSSVSILFERDSVATEACLDEVVVLTSRARTSNP